MNVFDWLRGLFTNRGKALKIYRRGMILAKSKNPVAAIESYRQVIEMPDAPADVVSMALFNRGLVYVANGEVGKGTADLKAVLKMDRAPAEVKERARHKLVRMTKADEKAASKANGNSQEF